MVPTNKLSELANKCAGTPKINMRTLGIQKFESVRERDERANGRFGSDPLPDLFSQGHARPGTVLSNSFPLHPRSST